MKARVKATGALLIVRPYDGSYYDWICDMDGETGSLWKTDELELIGDYELDYWEKLKHQYAGMAMQGILANCNHQLWEREANSEGIARQSYAIATTLVNKLKEESQCEK